MTKNESQKSPTTVKRVAIIGAGPRGLSALESMYNSVANCGLSLTIKTLLFNHASEFATGIVYDTNQADSNWLNISERGLTLPHRDEIKLDNVVIPYFPSYHIWAGYDEEELPETQPDFFPLRSSVGKYLNQRFSSIAVPLEEAGLLELIIGEVTQADWQEKEFVIHLSDCKAYVSDEVVLTIGHQSTKLPKQLTQWLAFKHSSHCVELFTEPYPVEDILGSKTLSNQSVIALRGFGLATIDVMRSLTIGCGGKFEIVNQQTLEVNYSRSGNEPKAIVPFSLDGLPLVPKLVNPKLDQYYLPTIAEKTTLKTQLSHIAKQGIAVDNLFLITAITPVIARVFTHLKEKAINHQNDDAELHRIIRAWLCDEKFKHDLIVSKQLSAHQALKKFIGMATGTELVSLDFCAGHVWRHCQPTLYKSLSFSNLNEEVMASIVKLDEGLKRYTFGPPVASLQQLDALVRDGIVRLDYVDDPTIKASDNGWLLSKGDTSITANIMINTVLDPPKILDVVSPLVCHLLEASALKPIHSELGVDTESDGRVLLQGENTDLPLAVLGRLAKGTILGVDAILECFNDRSKMWADGVIRRAKNTS